MNWQVLWKGTKPENAPEVFSHPTEITHIRTSQVLKIVEGLFFSIAILLTTS